MVCVFEVMAEDLVYEVIVPDDIGPFFNPTAPPVEVDEPFPVLLEPGVQREPHVELQNVEPVPEPPPVPEPRPGPSTGSAEPPTPVPNPSMHDSEIDIFDEEVTADRVRVFYEDLRACPTYWVKLRVTFYSPRRTCYHLCARCAGRSVYCVNTFVYYDCVSFHRDCYRDGYFCTFCDAKLYTIVL